MSQLRKSSSAVFAGGLRILRDFMRHQAPSRTTRLTLESAPRSKNRGMSITIRHVVGFACLAVFLAPVTQAQQSTAPATPSVHQHDTESRDHFEHRFDNVEALIERFDDPARDEWQMPSRVIDALGIGRGDVVADIGAGTGYFSVRLARLPARPAVYAVDIEPALVTHLRHRAMLEGLTNVTAVQAAADPEQSARTGRRRIDRRHLPPHHQPCGLLHGPQGSNETGRSSGHRRLQEGSPGRATGGVPVLSSQIHDELTSAGFSLQAQHDFLPRQIFLVFTAS